MAEKAADNKKKKTRAFEKIIKDFKENGRKPIKIKGRQFRSVSINFVNGNENEINVDKSAEYPNKSSDDFIIISVEENGNNKNHDNNKKPDNTDRSAA